MELAYPTIKNQRLTHDINQLDKLARSILLSARQIPASQSVNKRLKSKILKIISRDNAQKLCQTVESEVISFDTNIGTQGSCWNMLHFCAKSDSPKCIDYILKTQFQEFDEQYRKLVNSRTIEGYTPIIIAIISRSHKALQSLLYFGGIDLHIRDQHKMSPYEIALNYKNDHAIKLLMNYQALSKKKQYVNKQALDSNVVFPKKYFCHTLMNNLLFCLTLGMYNHQFEDGDNQEIYSGKNIQKSSFITSETVFIDYVHIGSKKQLPGYDIQWKKAQQIFCHKVNLFGSYNPFEIIQPNFTIKNHLIIFQCLSQQPWILRRNIKMDSIRHGFYNITLYPKKLPQKVCIDQHVPYIKQRKQAMFLSDSAEIWPMLLQKALAKVHDGYFALNAIQPAQLLGQISGFPTFQIKLSQFDYPKQILPFLQKLSAKNYLFLMKGKENSKLCETPGSIDCFTTLNFYQKSQQSLVLINCPFISQQWKQKQKYEPLALKLIKGHYNTHNQMCVWIEEKEIINYFQSIIFSMTLTNFQRTQIKIKATNLVFIKFRIQSKKQENVVFQLVDQDNDYVYDLKYLEIFKNEGQQQVQVLKRQQYIPKVAQIQCKPGEYMCFYQLNSELNNKNQKMRSNTNNNNLLLLCWSVDLIQPQFIQQQFGILEWFGHLRHYFSKIDEKCVVQSIAGYSLVLLKQTGFQTVSLRCQNIQNDQIIQGRFLQQKGENHRVELVNDKPGGIHYCVIKKQVDAQSVLFDYI